jgi:mannan endo-1,4-beta-mannosidase
MTVYTDWIGTPRDGLPVYEEIAKTGANTVRIVWSYKENTTAKELDNAITNAAKNKLFPMVEVLDRTCQWSREAFDEILAFWLKPEILSVLKKHEKYLLLNFANELGNNVTTLETYKSEYKRAVEKLRAAGIKSPIVIDAPGCGQDETTMLQAGNYLINSDPLHNIIMSIHLWWVPQNNERITKLFTEAVRLNIPLIIGEFSGLAVDCKTSTNVDHILKMARDNKVGWLPWSWDSANGCKPHSMTTDNTFNGLFGYGKEVAVTHSYSIKNTAVRSQCF